MEHTISSSAPVPKKKAISYIRWSTRSQTDGDSAERQLANFFRWCAANDLEPDLSASMRDEGLSAFKGNHLKKGGRLGLFLAAVKAGKYPNHVLVSENVDRLSRQGGKIARKIVEQIVDNGVDVHITNINTKIIRGWENYPAISLILDIEFHRAWTESLLKSERCTAGLLKLKRRAAEEGLAISERVPWWMKATRGQKIDESCLIPERVAAVRRIFQLAGQNHLGATRIIKVLMREKHKPFTPPTPQRGVSHGWTPSYVRQILLHRAVLGEFQPRKLIDGKQVPDPDVPVIPNYYPAIITQSEWDAARAAVAFKNRKHKGGLTGHVPRKPWSNRGGDRGGGRLSDTTVNLFGSLVRDESQEGLNALRTNRAMWYQPAGTDYARRRQHTDLTTKSYMVSFFCDQDLKANRIRYSHLEEGVLEFLNMLDWKAVAGESEPQEMKEKQKELDSVKTEIYRTEQLIIRWKKEAREMPDSKSLFRAIDGAEEELAKLVSRRDTLISEIETIRTETEVLYSIDYLQALIRENSPEAHEVRTKLRVEIHKRITKIGLEFFHTRVAGKVIKGTITFVNGATRHILFFPEYDCAVIFGAERKFSHKVLFTPDKYHKLNNSVCRKMFDLHLLGWTNRKIAAETGYSPLTVGHVINGHIRPHIHAEYHGKGPSVTSPGPVVKGKTIDEWLENAA
jgi:DNA invertase Pin-like site-specific DNA recombinase